ncbi:MAG: MFS transporter [Casimicrobiaceae bacterium]
MSAPDPGAPPGDVRLSSLSPLRHRSFRILWLAWVAACLCMWMSDVAAAWLMTSLTASPVMIALVQTAATLPIFLAGLPSGALADIVDRRRLLILTQAWAIIVALALFATASTATLNPVLLLLLVFANGLGLAARWPAFSALIPELVPANEVALGSALSGVANNGARIAGPLIAGAIITSAGSAYVFAFNAALSVVSGVLLLRWSYARKTSALPRERIAGAIRVGIQHVRQSPRLRYVMVRVIGFHFHSVALIALLPLVAKNVGHGNARTFTLLMAAMGAGAVCAALSMATVNRRFSPQQRLTGGSILFASATIAAALAPVLPVAMLALFAAGTAWMFGANTLMVSGTMALPDWVRARGLSMFQMAMMGSAAIGAALWGYVASLTSVPASLILSGVSALAALYLARRARLEAGPPEDLAPAPGWTLPEVTEPVDHDRGPVLVMIEYQIDPARTDEFLEVMRESRRVWLGHGLQSWNLFSDISRAGRHVEHMVDESWAAYLRRNERVAVSYLPLRERKLAMHTGPGAPVVTRYVASSVGR